MKFLGNLKRSAAALAVVGLFAATQAPTQAVAAPVVIGGYSNPNYCINDGSTATDCHVALDILNVDPAGPLGQIENFVDGHIRIYDTHRLQITFTANQAVSFGDLYFNVADAALAQVTGWSIDSVTRVDGAANGSYALDTTFNAPAVWGDFNVMLDDGRNVVSKKNPALHFYSGSNGYADSVTSLTFSLYTANYTWTNLLTQQLLQLNGDYVLHNNYGLGQSAMGHVWLAGQTGNNSYWAAWPNCTDQQTCPTTTEVPTPAPLALFGTGLLALALVRRRRGIN